MKDLVRKLNQLESGGPEADVFAVLTVRDRLVASNEKPY